MLNVSHLYYLILREYHPAYRSNWAGFFDRCGVIEKKHKFKHITESTTLCRSPGYLLQKRKLPKLCFMRMCMDIQLGNVNLHILIIEITIQIPNTFNSYSQTSCGISAFAYVHKKNTTPTYVAFVEHFIFSVVVHYGVSPDPITDIRHSVHVVSTSSTIQNSLKNTNNPNALSVTASWTPSCIEIAPGSAISPSSSSQLIRISPAGMGFIEIRWWRNFSWSLSTSRQHVISTLHSRGFRITCALWCWWSGLVQLLPLA